MKPLLSERRQLKLSSSMFSRRKGRCCITATRRSSNAPLNPPVVSFAASSNNSPVSPATYPRIPPRKHKFLYLDGANFRVRINGHVSVQSFCAVLGVSEENQRFEVLALEMGDREQADLWESIFRSLADRDLDLEAVELGILDGLPGLEATFKRFFSRAQTQRCRSEERRVGKECIV